VELGHVTDRISEGVHELRDRTADVIGADGGSVFREIAGVSRDVATSEKRLTGRIDEAERSLLDRMDVAIAGDRRTTWPRRLFWIGVGVAAGVAAAYLGDPDRGRARRAQLSDQATARSRELAGQVTTQAKQTANEARGAVIEGAKDRLPERAEPDARLLEQRIKSEVFGHRGDVEQVVLRVDGPGSVALKGTVPTPMSEAELITAVSEVDGVIDVTSELAVAGS
jgi:gas vesicle protein